MKKLTEYTIYAVLIAALMAVGGWFVDGWLRIILLAVLYFVEMEVLISIVRLVLREPEPVKMSKEEAARAEDQWYLQRQDPAWFPWLRPVGIVLTIVAFALVVTGFIDIGSYALHSVGCLVLSTVCVILCGAFPAYFSMSHLEEEKGRICTFPIVNLMIPWFLSLGAGAIRALTECSFSDWMAVLEWNVLAAAVVGGLMRLALPELRRHGDNWAGAIFFLLIFGLGIAAPLNHLLDGPPRLETATVVSYNPGGHRNPPDYTIRLENGEQINMSARHTDGEGRFCNGEKIQLEYHEGGLGIPYYCYPEE